MEVGETEKIKNLVQSVRESVTPGRRAAAYCYSKAVYSAFREISELREEGFSMAVICEVMEKNGLLPEHASPHSFRRAFRKESARRGRTEKEIFAKIPDRTPLNGGVNGKIKNETAAPVRHIQKPAELNNGKKSGEEESEKERLRRLIGGREINTGNGTIVRLPNGEFEF